MCAWPTSANWGGSGARDNWWAAPTAAGRRIFACTGATFIAALRTALRRELGGESFLPPPRPRTTDTTITDAVRVTPDQIPSNRWDQVTSAALYEVAVRQLNSTELPVSQRSGLTADEIQDLQFDYLNSQIGFISLRIACWLVSGRQTVAYRSIEIETASLPPAMGALWGGPDTGRIEVFDPATGTADSSIVAGGTAETPARSSGVGWVVIAGVLVIGGLAIASMSKPSRRRYARRRASPSSRTTIQIRGR